jgi:hypothetical protein
MRVLYRTKSVTHELYCVSANVLGVDYTRETLPGCFVARLAVQNRGRMFSLADVVAENLYTNDRVIYGELPYFRPSNISEVVCRDMRFHPHHQQSL